MNIEKIKGTPEYLKEMVQLQSEEIAALLAENARLREVVEAARAVEKSYWNFEKSMLAEVSTLKAALRKLDAKEAGK